MSDLGPVSGSPISFVPSKFTDKTAAEEIAELSLNEFVDKWSPRIIADVAQEQWVNTSFRPRIKGLMDRYNDFSRRCGRSIFYVLRTQERHWLSYCQTNDVFKQVCESFVNARAAVAITKYSDLFSHTADAPSVNLGSSSFLPVNIVHDLETSAALSDFAEALMFSPSVWSEIGRAWSLSTVIGKVGDEYKPLYDEWSKIVVHPIIDSVHQRAEYLARARDEVLCILKLRQLKKW